MPFLPPSFLRVTQGEETMKTWRRRIYKTKPSPVPTDTEFMAHDSYLIGIISDLNRMNANNLLKMRLKHL
jgi:hypothetical protein